MTLFFTLFCLFIFVSKIEAQNILFSQTYSSPTIISPSFTGLVEKDRMALNYRDQWPAIPNTYVTYAMSYDRYFPKWNSGLGIQFLKDRAGSGDLSLTNVSFMYSYDIKVNKDWNIRPGISFVLSERSINFFDLTFGDQITANSTSPYSNEPVPNEKRQYVDFTSSVLAYSGTHWTGLTVEHLLQPNQSFKGDTSKVGLKYTFIVGTRIPIKQSNRRLRIKESISFTALYRNQSAFDQLDLGAYYTKEPFVVGLWMRGFPLSAIISGQEETSYLDALIILLGYQIGDMSIGYSFDFTVSSLLNHTGGAHEISVVYQFKNKLKRSSRKKYAAVPCPGF